MWSRAYVRPWHVRATARYDTRVQGSLAVTVARKRAGREREREREKGERKRIAVARRSPSLGKAFSLATNTNATDVGIVSA